VAITRPKANLQWDRYRILVRESFGATGTSQNQSAPGWTELIMKRRGTRRHGYVFERCSRGALPFVGEAEFYYDYGQFDDTTVGLSAASVNRAKAGTEWDPSEDSLALQDLQGYEVRIQEADRAGTNWRTVWWGQVQHQSDEGWPAAGIPAGRRHYHCVDGLQRTQYWVIDRHGYKAQHFDSATVRSYSNVRGAMGYNVGLGGEQRDSRLAKNRGSGNWTNDAGVSVVFHATPGSANANLWSDREAAEHALAVVKPVGEPLFLFSGYTDPLVNSSCAWEVKEGETVWSVLTRICRRERARGLAFVDWDDDSGDPTGPLTVKISITPQLPGDVSFNDPESGTTYTVAGATTSGTTATVDLIGDHCTVASRFRLGDPYQYRFDYLESYGEYIEVLATLAYIDGRTGSSGTYDGIALVRGWNNSEQNTFKADSTANRQQAGKYRPVYQLHRIRPDWTGIAGDGNGGTLEHIDYRCSNNGSILVPLTNALPDTPGDAVKVLSDLPLYEGYDYSTSTPVRWGGGSEYTNPARRKLFGLVRKSSDRYLEFDQTDGSVYISVDENGGIMVTHSGDDGAGTRMFSDTTSSGLAPSGATHYNYSDLVLVVGLRLPHRVRLASGDPNGKKRGRLVHPDHHLWLAPAGSIWDVNTATGSSSAGYGVRRRACSGNVSDPGLLRDDRLALAGLHALAWAWYGPGTVRRSAEWSIRDCGLRGTYEAVTGTSISSTDTPETKTYPTLGKLITTITANGQEHTINTPVTRIAYDNTTGTTSWSTEWAELEMDTK